MKTSLKTPVVFLIYNRPETTQQVFAAIRSARPARLLVVADGPRRDHADDADNVAATQQIIEGVDWPCEVLKNYSDTNLGCRKRVSSGLDWAFALVPEAIVLEDDCVPDPSFFWFCEQLLARYRDDSRIMTISGTCLDTPSPSPYSYTFSRKAGLWGWASWRRAWRHFDVDMKTWPAFRDAGGVSACADTPAAAKFYEATFESTFQGLNNTWGWAWYYACLSQHGLIVQPTVNLISNVGFGSEATHTTRTDVPYAHLPLEQMGPLRHPPVVVHDKRADRVIFRQLHAGLFDGYRETQDPGDLANAPSESTERRDGHQPSREKYLEQRIVELQTALRAKGDIIQRFIRGHEYAELRAQVEHGEQQILDQQAKLRAKEDVIQALVRARASIPAVHAPRSSRLLGAARRLVDRMKRLLPGARGDSRAVPLDGPIEDSTLSRATVSDIVSSRKP